MRHPPYQPRLLDSTLKRLLGQVPAVLMTGPRATGKTTTAQQWARTLIRLDRPQEASVAAADPDALLRDRALPILLDEWQRVPSVLGAVKRAVDADASPGQFLLTGSARAQLDANLWPGTGRVIRLPMHGLTSRERLGRTTESGFFERLLEDDSPAFANPEAAPDLRGYVREILVGGFPLPALNLNPTGRAHWMESYLEQLVTRDAAAVAPGRNTTKLRRFVETLAIHTSCVIDDGTLYRAAGINRRTGQSYEALLNDLGLTHTLPAWWTNRMKRLVQRPKRLLNDAALAAAAVGVDEEGILRNGDVLGRLLETYVVAQLLGEAATAPQRIRLHHLRTERGRHEVDVIAELPGQQLVGIEIKASTSPSSKDARHLAWLRDSLGDQFIAGVVFHTGTRVFSLGDKLMALPIACLW